MIRLETTPFTFEGDILSGYLAGYGEAYGTDQPFLQFYSDENGSQLAIMDGVAIVRCGENAYEEIAAFLSLQPQVRYIRTDCQMAAFLKREWGTAYEVRPVMRCTVSLESGGDTVPLSPREIYPLLSRIFADFPSFEPWYLDVSYRERHGFCRNRAVVKDGAAVASAMTVAEWQGGAVIGAVATDPNHRGNGYASRCVTALTRQLQQQNKQVYICPKNEYAKRLYERLGFTVCDEIAWITV